MRSPFATDYSPIGVDIGACSMKAAQLCRTREGWRVSAATSLARVQIDAPLDRTAVRRLADVLYRQGFQGNQIVLAAPSDKLAVDILELPPRAAGAPLEQIARSEMARITGAAVGTFEMALWDLPTQARANNSTSVLAVALRHSDSDPWLDLFEEEGLTVRGVDAPSCAVARACAPQTQTSAGITTILDIGWNAASLVLIHQGIVVYRRALADAGVCALHKQIGLKLGLAEKVIQYVLGPSDDAEDVENRIEADLWAGIRALVGKHVEGITQELQASFAYAAHRYPEAEIKQLLLIGGGATLPDVCGCLTRCLDVEVKIMALAQLCGGAAPPLECPVALAEKCQSPTLITALGLAQYEER
jgi:Tfp pilus assembly PilM family ATPase